jgi:uridine kinase
MPCFAADENPGTHNFDHPASIDFPLLASHLRALQRGDTVSVPHYDFMTHSRTADVTVIDGTSVDVIILDGIFVLWDEAVRKCCHLNIFCSEDLDVCLARRYVNVTVLEQHIPAWMTH